MSSKVFVIYCRVLLAVHLSVIKPLFYDCGHIRRTVLLGSWKTNKKHWWLIKEKEKKKAPFDTSTTSHFSK